MKYTNKFKYHPDRLKVFLEATLAPMETAE
jgi:hypothetical protein